MVVGTADSRVVAEVMMGMSNSVVVVVGIAGVVVVGLVDLRPRVVLDLK